jgi:glycosyltransferase involved in cell wall biosynthesis
MVPALFDRERGVVGGAERYALELARSMAKRVSTALLTFGKESVRLEQDGLPIFVERAHFVRGHRLNPWTPALARWVRNARVVHCHQRAVLASSTAALLGRIMRRPVFVSDLGGGAWDVSGYLSTDSWYAGHLHISEYSRTVYGHANLRSAHVIWGGVDTDRFAPDLRVPRQRSVLFVGRILAHKGVNDLVTAMPEGVPLEIIGEAYDARFKADLNRLSTGKRVAFRHGSADAEVVNAYRRAAVAVLPSVYRDCYGGETKVPELLGQTLLEAMACETPVICTNVASMPEIVEDGVSGFIVPPNDPQTLRNRIEWILGHPVEAAAMGRAGRTRILERFTWDRVVTRCLALYGIGRAP